ncbi:MAG TPA: flagellar biosynthesis protein FlhB [Anaerolineaceae bacterium]|nr:flagellar biosynthesis protein FlhB [Anaerolineaceae bacterium]
MAEKTEAPSSKRISEARAKGQVARSHELNTAMVLIMGVVILSGPGGTLINDLKNLIISSIGMLPKGSMSTATLSGIVGDVFGSLAPSLGLILVALLVTGAATTLIQTKFLISASRLKPDLSRLNPMNGLKRIFSSYGLIELGKATLKLFVVGFFAYDFLQANISSLMELGNMNLGAGIAQWAGLARSLGLRVAEAYLILAILDFIYQRWNYNRSLKMTLEEVKEEYKQLEGDPVIRGRIRSQMRRLARMRMMSNVHKATVVITNPTHLAIAIEYDSGRMNAPRVLAKGAGLIAQRIVAIARESSIPIVQNIPLAHAIFDNVEIEHEIPPELYTAMAEVLAYVFRLQGQATQKATA